MQTELTWGTITQTAWLIAILLSVAATGCHEGVGEDCQAPLSTQTMRNEYVKAYSYHMYCQLDNEMRMDECIEQADPERSCGEEYNLQQRWCIYYFARKLNKVPLRECGATAWIINGTPDETENPVDPNYEDSDGDGVPNYWEVYLGYNPCTPHSFGCSYPLDGTDDFDADGIPDSEDEWPICNMDGTDPADYGSDCV